LGSGGGSVAKQERYPKEISSNTLRYSFLLSGENTIFEIGYYIFLAIQIPKIRELKNISSNDMADRINLSLQGYGRIERDEVDINVERLLEIAHIFEMKPEDILIFDEKTIFNNHGTANDKSFSVIHEHQSSKQDALYEDKIKLLEDKNQLQAEMIEMLKEKIKGLEGE
jgi:transcriptional regulator with XRE-family HTH domain